MAKKGKKQQKAASAAMPNSFELVAISARTISKHWKTLGALFLSYFALNLLLSSGFGGLNGAIDNIKQNFDNASQNHSSRLSIAANGFTELVGNSSSGTSESATVLHNLLIVVISLVIIWSLRQLLAGETVSVKQAYYHSMGPFIPFLLVIGIIFVQLLPFALGTTLIALILSTVFPTSGLAVALFSILVGALLIFTIYMLSASVLALYIVTLPDMQPLKALRSAKNLVEHKRWKIARRLVFLPILLIAAIGVFIIPLILISVPLVAPVFFVLTAAAIFFAHIYFYSLYRSLL